MTCSGCEHNTWKENPYCKKCSSFNEYKEYKGYEPFMKPSYRGVKDGIVEQGKTKRTYE